MGVPNPHGIPNLDGCPASCSVVPLPARFLAPGWVSRILAHRILMGVPLPSRDPES